MAGSPRTLVPIEERPFIAETPIDALAEPRTPTSLFFVRNHFDLPREDADAWRVRVDGLVDRPLTLALRDLRNRPARTVSVTLECAGNGRTAMVPPPPGTPWAFGAVGTAEFTGVSLRSVLEEARLRPAAEEILFVGADHGEVEPGREESFARSLPAAVALQDDVLLAWAMSGEPLAPAHGSPLRLVVPGWYGVASVKWLVQITALSQPFEGYFQKEQYVYIGEAGTPRRTPVTRMRVRAIIGRPANGAVLRPGPSRWPGRPGRALGASAPWISARTADTPGQMPSSASRSPTTPRPLGESGGLRLGLDAMSSSRVRRTRSGTLNR